MSEQDQGMRAISREWMAARIVVIGGFIIAIGLGTYFAMIVRADIVARRHVALAEVQQGQAVENAQQQTAQAGLDLCTSALNHAKDFGIIPPFGQLASAEPKPSDVTGRYVCLAVTQVSKYTLAADLLCRDLKKPACVMLHSVTQDDGTVLYKKQG
jgi:hypothetical protein